MFWGDLPTPYEPYRPVPGACSSLYLLFGIESGLEKGSADQFGVNEDLVYPLPMAPGRVVARDCDLLLVGSCVYVRPLEDKNRSSYESCRSRSVSVSSSSKVDGKVRVSRIAEAKCGWLGLPAENDALRVGTL